MAGRLLLKIGFRKTSVFGGIFLTLGSIMLVTLSPNAGPIWAAAGSFLFGIGMGLTSTSFIVSVQSTVSWKQRGVATAAIMFMRNLGNTIGAALLGGILNLRLKEFFQENGGNLARNVTVDSVNSLLNQSERSRLPKQIRELLQDGLTNSLHFVYYAVLLFALISFLLIFFLPKNNENSVS